MPADKGKRSDATDADAVDAWDGRGETEAERADRNWDELLQEFRVFQTGTQILAAFLLTLPFQQRFVELSSFDVGVYLVLVFLAVLITVLALAPVSLHRLLFRQKVKSRLVEVSSFLLLVCLAASSLLFAGIVLFVVGFLTSPSVGLSAGGGVFIVLLLIWVAFPVLQRRRRRG